MTRPAARQRRRGARQSASGCVWAVAALLMTVTGVHLATGCADPCCNTDGFPINLVPPAPGKPRGLLAKARYPGQGGTFDMSVDTGSPLTFFRRHGEKNQMVLRDFDLVDGQPPATAVRGQFRGIEVLPLELSPDGPEAVLGGSLLHNFSVQFDFAKSAMTLWPRQGATDAFLSVAGYSVIHFGLLGGAELTAESRPDFLGLTGPVEVPATRVVLRACGGPAPFDPKTPAPEPAVCCTRGDAVTLATGTNLALVMATGVGPLVLSRSAWDRMVAVQATPPPEPAPGSALPIPSLPAPLTDVLWSTIPRLALVNQELDDANNQGACVDLGRARRLEWQEQEDHRTHCIQPCDSDPGDPTKAENGPAYVEFGTNIVVAIVPDSTALLQSLRAEIRPEGPEIDGLIGANVFTTATVEIDYRSEPQRAIVACPDEADGVRSTTCLASARCPRLSTATDMRACFKQKARSLPPTCQPVACPR